ncbi:MAG TPA: hypothetical protein VES21_02425 [Nocardioidaceae bacterium]|nr:hypothetical protein [Nocardioidaceae bacterium]
MSMSRKALIVAVSMVLFAVVVPLVLSQGDDVYDAEAQVGPARALTLTNLAALPNLGETVFDNGAVENAVRQELGGALGIADTESVIPERVELVASQDNIVFGVIGHGSDPEDAKRLADLAAAVFTEELNRYSNPAKPDVAAVGKFVVTHEAIRPTQPAQGFSAVLAAGIGLLVGALVGLAIVAAIEAWSRRPTGQASASPARG